jgi:glycosyltransferase involved in cell wall biosynthesis
MRLLIISDTTLTPAGADIVGLGPVVREVCELRKLFSQITWIGFSRAWLSADRSMIPVPDDIECVMLPAVGGDRIQDKMSVLAALPRIARLILHRIDEFEVVHTRGPSAPAMVAALLSMAIRNRRWWHKYAGNWVQEPAPLAYTLQRRILRFASHTRVTINGRWPGQPNHCRTFANPCLSHGDRVAGNSTLMSKSYSEPLVACYVGRLDEAKGARRVKEAMTSRRFPFAELHFVGDGPLRKELEDMAGDHGCQIMVHGSLGREALVELYRRCHCLILPSVASEGFPKVIAEAMNFGCVPVVSDVSAIPQYISQQNGYLWRLGHHETFWEWLAKQDFGASALRTRADQGYTDAEQFTFQAYLASVQRIIEELGGGVRVGSRGAGDAG